MLENLDDHGGVDAVALVGEHVPESAQVRKRRGQPPPTPTYSTPRHPARARPCRGTGRLNIGSTVCLKQAPIGSTLNTEGTPHSRAMSSGNAEAMPDIVARIGRLVDAELRPGGV